MTIDIRHDETRLSAEALIARPHARIPDLGDVLPYLASPDSGRPLIVDPRTNRLSDGTHAYPQLGNLPVLLPARLAPHFDGRLRVPPHDVPDPLMQYFHLGTLRHGGEINAASSNVHYQRHLHRLHAFVQRCHGVVVDVGCDDATVGASLFSADSFYIGIDPFSHHPEPFRLVGVAEFLPIRPESVDVVLFNTTLDHILDWHRAIDEAVRVLAPGGQLVIASLVWTSAADLLGDSVHFHHFRDYEILGALSQLAIEDVARYDYKGDRHRHGMYVRATKR